MLIALGVVWGSGLARHASASVAAPTFTPAALRQQKSLRSAHPTPATDTYTISLTPASLADMADMDVAANQDYLTSVRGRQGDAAAARAEASIRAPYAQRIAAMKAAGQDHQDLSVPVLTLWGSLTFSAVSFDPALQVKDPVSLLFWGQASPDDVYSQMTQSGDFQDDKGFDAQNMTYVCPSSTQWVLMGEAGQTLQWQPSTRGVMQAGEQCMSGTRHHMRIFGGAQSDAFGAWSVATPHYELWTTTPTLSCHVVQSWSQGRDVFAGFWDGIEGAKHLSLKASSEPVAGWGSSASYQGVSFDGQGMAIEMANR